MVVYTGLQDALFIPAGRWGNEYKCLETESRKAYEAPPLPPLFFL